MKKTFIKMKRNLFVMFSLVLLMTVVFPFHSMEVYARTVNLESEVNRLRTKFPNGKFWNHWGSTNNPDGWTDTPCQSHTGTGNPDCNVFNGRLQCMGYASKIFHEVYGADILDAPLYTNIEEVRAGDFIALNNGGHYAFVLSRSGDTITVTECNSIYPQDYCRIYWDTTYNIRNCGFKDGRHAPSDVEIVNYHNPIGDVNVISSKDNIVRIRGWAYDEDDVNASLDIHVYIGGPAGQGTCVAVEKANMLRKDVNDTWPGVGNYHGFDFTFTTSLRGTQDVYVYAINVSGGAHNPCIGEGSVNITGDITSPTVLSARIISYDKDGYTVTATANDNIGVTNIKFPTWISGASESDIIWYEGSAVSNGTSTCRIKVSDFQNYEGRYATDVRAYDAAGNMSAYYRLNIDIDRTPPKISNVKLLNIDRDGYTLQCNVSDNIEVEQVMFATCTSVSGRNDWKYYKVSDIVEGVATCRIYTSDFNNKEGIYCTDIYAYDTYGNRTDWSKENTCYPTIDRTSPEISKVSVTRISDSSYKVSCRVTDSSNLKSVQFGISVNGKSDVWREASLVNGLYEATIKASEFSGELGEYGTTIKAIDDYGNEEIATAETINLTSDKTPLIPMKQIALDGYNKSLFKGQSFTLSATPSPSNTTSQIRWSTSNSSVATVEGQGLTANVVAKGVGTAQIIAAADGVVATCTVSVKEVPQGRFIDVSESDWFNDPVYYAYDNGIMSGTGNSKFSPLMSTDRSMVVQILYNVSGKPAMSGITSFDDVPSNQWYAKAVQWAAETGVTAGVSKNSFAPEREVTRQEVAALLFRYAKQQGYDVSGRNDLSSFVDGNQVDSWALEAMQWANNAGVINGKGNSRLDPRGTATRAEIATMMKGFMTKYQ